MRVCSWAETAARLLAPQSQALLPEERGGHHVQPKTRLLHSHLSDADTLIVCRDL